ncbi:hypothetical protein L596_022179 [Steinernema carpocapsae]|uniref:Uncharacterized protein n=1 Tax=Steinernema carpocapsae TaxID=34508 RepID=A0A4U5ML19_STECR|nr:hypothetical protein L596_022179 [Steinernema carpocapsae]
MRQLTSYTVFTKTHENLWDMPEGCSYAPQRFKDQLLYVSDDGKVIAEVNHGFEELEVVWKPPELVKSVKLESFMATKTGLFGLAKSIEDRYWVVPCQITVQNASVDVRVLGESQNGELTLWEGPTFYNETGFFWRKDAGKIGFLELGNMANVSRSMMKNQSFPMSPEDVIEAAVIGGRLFVLNLTAGVLEVAEENVVSPPIAIETTGLPASTSTTVFKTVTGLSLWLILCSNPEDVARKEMKSPVLLIIDTERLTLERHIMWSHKTTKNLPAVECSISADKESIWVTDGSKICEVQIRSVDASTTLSSSETLPKRARLEVETPIQSGLNIVVNLQQFENEDQKNDQEPKSSDKKPAESNDDKVSKGQATIGNRCVIS